MIFGVEHRERLDVDCNELRSQLSTIEKQLITIKVKLLETEVKVQQLAGQTDATLRAKIN